MVYSARCERLGGASPGFHSRFTRLPHVACVVQDSDWPAEVALPTRAAAQAGKRQAADAAKSSMWAARLHAMLPDCRARIWHGSENCQKAAGRLAFETKAVNSAARQAGASVCSSAGRGPSPPPLLLFTPQGSTTEFRGSKGDDAGRGEGKIGGGTECKSERAEGITKGAGRGVVRRRCRLQSQGACRISSQSLT